MSEILDTLPDLAGFPAKKLDRMRALSNKIARAAAARYFGSDLILHVYLAGLSHGAALAPRPACEPVEGEG